MYLTDEQIQKWNELSAGKFYWCKLCHRVYTKETWKRRRWLCPTDQCPGDFWQKVSWTMVRSQNPQLPETPTQNSKYDVVFVSSEG